MSGLREQFGAIDIYLFDQILRGNILPGMRLLDAGCGGGRNLAYFLREGYEVFGLDPDGKAIASVREMAAVLAPALPASNFRVETIEASSYAAASADVVISSAVLHFARDDPHFRALLQGSWLALKPGGLFFCRLASSIGMAPDQLTPIAGRRYLLPDGSERYLVDAAMLDELTEELGGEYVDPLKTTVVQNQRCMTTWVLRRKSLP